MAAFRIKLFERGGSGDPSGLLHFEPADDSGEIVYTVYNRWAEAIVRFSITISSAMNERDQKLLRDVADRISRGEANVFNPHERDTGDQHRAVVLLRALANQSAYAILPGVSGAVPVEPPCTCPPGWCMDFTTHHPSCKRWGR